MSLRNVGMKKYLQVKRDKDAKINTREVGEEAKLKVYNELYNM